MVKLFDESTDIAGLLRNPFMGPEYLESLLLRIQDVAEERLERACARLRVSLVGLQDAQVGEALRKLAKGGHATPSEKHAHELLKACIDARSRLDQYARDRIILNWNALFTADHAAAGKRQSSTQRARRSGKPGSSDTHSDDGRNARIKAFHARKLASDSARTATSDTASEFELSTRTIRRILKS